MKLRIWSLYKTSICRILPIKIFPCLLSLLLQEISKDKSPQIRSKNKRHKLNSIYNNSVKKIISWSKHFTIGMKSWSFRGLRLMNKKKESIKWKSWWSRWGACWSISGVKRPHQVLIWGQNISKIYNNSKCLILTVLPGKADKKEIWRLWILQLFTRKIKVL